MGPAEPAGTRGAEGAPTTLNVEVAYSPGPGVVDLQPLVADAPCTALQALQASGLLARHGLAADDVAGPAATLAVAVWGKVKPADTLLRERDRVELLRPLRVDPKEARRQRYKAQAGDRPKRPRPVPRAQPLSDTPTR